MLLPRAPIVDKVVIIASTDCTVRHSGVIMIGGKDLESHAESELVIQAGTNVWRTVMTSAEQKVVRSVLLRAAGIGVKEDKDD